MSSPETPHHGCSDGLINGQLAFIDLIRGSWRLAAGIVTLISLLIHPTAPAAVLGFFCRHSAVLPVLHNFYKKRMAGSDQVTSVVDFERFLRASSSQWWLYLHVLGPLLAAYPQRPCVLNRLAD